MEGHVCGFFHDQALRAEVLDAFFVEGVEAGHKCYGLLDSSYPGPETTISPRVSDAIASGQIEFLSPEDSYLTGGRFDASSMLDHLEELASQARDKEGYPGVWAVGEMTWASDPDFADIEELCGYEAAVTRHAERFPRALLCLYDLSRFDAETIVRVLRVHPWMMAANVALPNPCFQSVERLAGDADVH